MTSTRILARRRLVGTSAAPHVRLGVPAPQAGGPRARRRTRGFVQVAGTLAAERLQVSVLGHAYLGLGAVVIALLFYLAIAAQITQSSYQIARLQDQQRQLIAEQDQLRYQEVTLHAPAQVQAQAAKSGMERVVPSNYIAGQQVAIDLSAPVGAGATDTTPRWVRAVAAVIETVGATKDVMAAGNR